MTSLGEFSSKTQQRLVAGVGVVMIAALGRSAPVPPTNIDPGVYHRIINSMRGGGRFHASIDEVFRANGMGPVDSVLAVRSPVGFWFLTVAGSDRMAWILLLIAATVAATLLSRVLERPIHAVFVAVFFAIVGQVAWTAPELWASILVVAAVALALDDQWLPAAAVATVATTIRELAVLVLVGLLVSAVAARRPRRSVVAPLCGLVAVAALYAVHWSRVTPYLAPAGEGRQARLFGTGSFPGGSLAMMSTWIPGGVVLGPLLFLAALMWAHRRGRLALLVPVLGLVLTGIVVDRPEWATFVVPLSLALGLDEIDWRGANRSSAARRRHSLSGGEGPGRGPDAVGRPDLVADRPDKAGDCRVQRP